MKKELVIVGSPDHNIAILEALASIIPDAPVLVIVPRPEPPDLSLVLKSMDDRALPVVTKGIYQKPYKRKKWPHPK